MERSVNPKTAEKLQIQKAASVLYKEVKSYFEKNTVDDMIKSLTNINDNLKENKDYNVSIDEYSMLGFITYLIGVDMTSSREFVIKNVAENYRSRFVDNNLNNEEFINILCEVLKNINTNNFENAKNELKQILEKEIECDKNSMGELRIAIRNSLKHYAIPVPIAKDLSAIISKQKMSYNDILRYNHVMQIEAIFLDNSMKATINVLTNKLFVKSLEIGEKLYIQQKFSLVHFDSIISAKELLEKFPTCLMYATVPYGENIDKEVLKEKYFINDVDNSGSNNENSEQSEEKESGNNNQLKKLPEEDPDFFVRACAEEYLKKKIENIEDFENSIENIINSDSDFLQYFYHYIAYNKNNKENRKQFEEVWSEFTKEDLHNSLTSKIENLQNEGKEIAEKIFALIPEKNLGHIINYVRDCIDNLVIITDEKNITKSYLLSQFSENGISTYHHLQQIMSLIESQYISGAGFTSYCTLFDYIITQTEAKEIFEESAKLDDYNMRINVYTQLKNFYFSEEVNKEN